MPYLIDELKSEIDERGGRDTASHLASLEDRHFIGALNYLVFKVVRRRIASKGKSYFLFAAIVGTLLCCVLEIYRRLIAPYEDEKIQENGDVL